MDGAREKYIALVVNTRLRYTYGLSEEEVKDAMYAMYY
jgi:hypothetical protein